VSGPIRDLAERFYEARSRAAAALMTRGIFAAAARESAERSRAES